MGKFLFTILLMLTLLIPTSAFGVAYYYCSNASAGSANGTSWANCWDCEAGDSGAVNWGTLQTAAASQPVYLFMDGGSTSMTYTKQMTVGGSGSSNTNRIFIMPAYAAQQMSVPGDHSGRTGQAIIDRGGATSGAPAVSCNGYNYITIDGYSDPRPNGANASKLIFRDIHQSSPGTGIVFLYDTTYITIRNVEVYQETESNDGDGIHSNGASSQARNIIIEYCYIHDGGHAPAPQHAAVWLNNSTSSTIRYNQVHNWGTDNGEGLRCAFANSIIHHNLITECGTGIKDAQYIVFNTIYNAQKHAITHYEGQASASYVENNMIFLWDQASNGSMAIPTSNTSSSAIYMSGNVFYETTANLADVTIRRSGGDNWYQNVADLNAESDPNLYIQSANLVGTLNYLDNPPSNCDLSANATNAIDGAYTANWSPTQDFHGNTQVGVGWDIGYDEYGTPDVDVTVQGVTISGATIQ